MSEATATEKPATPALKALLGQKVGMTQIFDAYGRIIPVTVIQAGPCYIAQVLSPEKHGYAGVQVSFGAIREKAVTKPQAGLFKKANIPAARWMREFRTEMAASFQVGQALKAEQFVAGDYVDITGTAKGKGFAGAVKRHNFGGGPTTHGQSDRTRAPGSSGSNTYPGRVFKGKLFPGHLGANRTTVQHLQIVQVQPEKDVLLIRGAVPGPKHGLLVINETIKRVKHFVEHHAEAPKKVKKEAGAAAKPAAGGAAKAKAAK